jgi:hypothetical protein
MLRNKAKKQAHNARMRGALKKLVLSFVLVPVVLGATWLLRELRLLDSDTLYPYVVFIYVIGFCTGERLGFRAEDEPSCEEVEDVAEQVDGTHRQMIDVRDPCTGAWFKSQIRVNDARTNR